MRFVTNDLVQGTSFVRNKQITTHSSYGILVINTHLSYLSYASVTYNNKDTTLILGYN